jgi:hypothetical protein
MATFSEQTTRSFLQGTKSVPSAQPASVSTKDGVARQSGYARGSLTSSRATVGAAISPVVAIALIGIFYLSMTRGD